MDTIMSLVTSLGNHGIIWIAIAVLLLVQKRYRRWGVVMLVAMAATYLVGTVWLKPLVARPRPFIEAGYTLIIANPGGYSFPSGHTLASFTAATVVCCMPLGKGWKIGAVVLAVLIAFSRLYLFVHYPTDVLAGAVLGIIGALLAVRIARSWLRRGDKAAGKRAAARK